MNTNHMPDHCLWSVLESDNAEPVDRHDAATELYRRRQRDEPEDVRALAVDFDTLALHLWAQYREMPSRGEYPDSPAWLADELAAYADALRDCAVDMDEWARAFNDPNVYYGVRRGA